MAKRKYKTEISFDEKDLNISEIIKKGGEATLWEQVIVSALLEEEVAQLKSLCDEIKGRVKNTPCDNIKDSLIKDGKMSAFDRENDTILIVKTRYGDTMRVSMNPAVDSGFTFDKSITDYLDSLPDNMVRIPPKTLETKSVLETLFDNGLIPDVYKGYFSKHPIDITKISVKTEKGGK